MFQNVYFLEHLHYINIGDFERAEALIPDIEEGLMKYEAKINKARLLTFQFNIMVMYFVMHRFKEAATWADKVLEDKSEIKQGIHVVTRILYPIIHFELGHHDLVDNLTRSAYRFLLGKKRIHEFERLMVSYLKKMPFTPDTVQFNSMLQTFNQELSSLMVNPNISGTYGMEEVSVWVKSQLTNRKMNEILKESYASIR